MLEFMALEGYKSNKNVVYSSTYHCVWTPKYRCAVLVGRMAKRCEPALRLFLTQAAASAPHPPIATAHPVDEPLFRIHGRGCAPGGHKTNMLQSRRTYKYRPYPNRKQRGVLASTLEVCRELYNDALEERRDAWKTCRTRVTFHMQSAQLPACKEADATLGKVYSQVLQDVLRRVDKNHHACNGRHGS